MRYIAMNQFHVAEGKGEEFEKVWAGRQSFLAEVPGFLEFRLLRGPEGVYISHSIWASEAAFRAWTESEAFQRAHAQGGSRGLVTGPPVFTGYEVVIDTDEGAST
jgi:heme-degrading monooxygenase HmoA